MKLEKNGFHKRSIIPWYDSNYACFASIFFNACVVAFGGVGIILARQVTGGEGLVRFTCLLTGLGLLVVLSTLTRIILRYRSN